MILIGEICQQFAIQFVLYNHFQPLFAKGTKTVVQQSLRQAPVWARRQATTILLAKWWVVQSFDRENFMPVSP